MNRLRQLWRVARTVIGGGPVPLRVARSAVREHGAIQRTWELQALLCDVRRLRPRTVVEIGTHRGGTFAAFAAVAHPNARLVSIDRPEAGFGTTDEDVARLRALLRPGQSMAAIRGDSHDPATRARLRDALGGAPIAFLWIDGDHSAAGVRQDLAMYAPLVRATAGSSPCTTFMRTPRTCAARSTRPGPI
jgi:cephalosporin hydroxylase